MANAPQQSKAQSVDDITKVVAQAASQVAAIPEQEPSFTDKAKAVLTSDNAILAYKVVGVIAGAAVVGAIGYNMGYKAGFSAGSTPAPVM